MKLYFVEQRSLFTFH